MKQDIIDSAFIAARNYVTEVKMLKMDTPNRQRFFWETGDELC